MKRHNHPVLALAAGLKTSTPAISALSALLLSAAPALANDFAVGGSGADLVPITETRVQMQSEQIAMLLNGDHFDVTADYVFANDGAEPVKIQVGFPEILCPGDVDCVAKFTNLQTVVDGTPAPHRQGKLQRKHAWAKHLGTVWLFDVTFAPGTNTKIRHTYSVTTGGNVDQYDSFDYVTRTGATWAGKIEQAVFTLRLPPEAHIVSAGMGKPTLVQPKDGEPYVELKLEHEDWEPQTDIHLDFQLGALMPPDLGADRLKRSGVNPEHECTDVRSAKSAEQLQMCKNLIYAISGYKFTKPELSKYFYGGARGWRLAALPDFASEPGAAKVWVRGLEELPGHESSKMPKQSQLFLKHLTEVVAKELPAASASSGPSPAPTEALATAPRPEPVSVAPKTEPLPSVPRADNTARAAPASDPSAATSPPAQPSAGCSLSAHRHGQRWNWLWLAALASGLARHQRRRATRSGLPS